MNETAQFHISFFFLKGKACAGFLILRQLHGCYMQKYQNCISIIDILNPCQICDQCFQVRSFYFFYHWYTINVNFPHLILIQFWCVYVREREREINLVALSQLLHLGPKAQQFAYYLQWFLDGQPGAVYGFGEPVEFRLHYINVEKVSQQSYAVYF